MNHMLLANRGERGEGSVPTFRGPRSWSRARWLVVIMLLVAVAVAVILIVVFAGGGGGGGYGY
jgi:hypothetical protein